MTPPLDTLASLLSDYLLTLPTLSLPIKSKHLLRLLILHSPSAARTAALRLSDRAALDDALRLLAREWDGGTLSLDDTGGSADADVPGEVVLTAVSVDVGAARGTKRKRAEGDMDEDHEPLTPSAEPRLSKLDTLQALMQRGTARSALLSERFRSPATHAFEPICERITKADCARAAAQAPGGAYVCCDRVHFRPILRPHTDPSLGHCSYLNTCYSEPSYALSPSIGPPPARASGNVYLPSGLGAGGRGKEKAPCRYLHFEVDWEGEEGVVGVGGEGDGGAGAGGSGSGSGSGSGGAGAIGSAGLRLPEEQRLRIGAGPEGRYSANLLPPQWINCDLRKFDYSLLGKFHVIMADPPWDIHMSLPYGTMTDDEMRSMPIPALQDEGLLFLWVTGRAMEVGRECLRVWGYTRVDEIVWLKTNQLQRVIRTGRTGHWLNHTKEHLLVGVKAPHDARTGALVWPRWINRGLDTDVIVSEVRETSRKPDEVYGVIERMCPGGRKIEIFGRKHNARPGWITLGNQLGTDQIHEPDLAARLRKRYPERYPVPGAGGVGVGAGGQQQQQAGQMQGMGMGMGVGVGP